VAIKVAHLFFGGKILGNVRPFVKCPDCPTRRRHEVDGDGGHQTGHLPQAKCKLTCTQHKGAVVCLLAANFIMSLRARLFSILLE